MTTILVVEDEPKIARLARDYLEHAGFRVTTAADGPVCSYGPPWRGHQADGDWSSHIRPSGGCNHEATEGGGNVQAGAFSRTTSTHHGVCVQPPG